MVWSFVVATTAVGTSTPGIHGALLNRPSSRSTAGIDQALVLRNSAHPQLRVDAEGGHGTSGSVTASRSTRFLAYGDSGTIAAVISGKKNFSRRAPRKLRAVAESTSPSTRSRCRFQTSCATSPPIE